MSHPGSGQSLRWEEALRDGVRSTPGPNHVDDQSKPTGVRTMDRNIHLLEHTGGHVGQGDGLIALADVYHHREWLERCAICRE